MEVEPKENDDDIQESWWSAPASPMEALQKFSKGAVKRASESWHGSYSSSPVMNTSTSEQVRPRRSRSDVASSFPRSSSAINFQKWKSQMKRALYWRSRSFCEDRRYFSFDPEILANQKRQWYKIQSKALDPDKFKEPASLFEHFFIAGLRPDANLEAVEDTFFKRKRFEHETTKNETIDCNMRQFQQPTCPTLEPQILFMYPPGKRMALRLKDLASFCFPGGVKAGILKRSPSLSELNELLYGQGHLYKDDSSFIFSLKVQEFVQEAPVISRVSSPFSQSHSGCKNLRSVIETYLTTSAKFFMSTKDWEKIIIAQKHLSRISQFVNETSLYDYVPSPLTSKNNIINVDSPSRESDTDWMMDMAIPVASAFSVAAAAAGIISDEEVSRWEFESFGSATASDSTDLSQITRELDKDVGKGTHAFDDCTSEKSEKLSNALEHIYHGNDQFSETSFSSAISMAFEEESDEFFYNNHVKDGSDDIAIEPENKSDLLQIISGYHCMPVPERGSEIVFQPLEHLEPIEYRRPPVSAFGLCGEYFNLKLEDPKEVSQVKLKLAAAEEALALSLWTIATICRVLSLESVLALVTSVLLEKQVVVLCPNLGVLSAVVLSLIPIIRPFEWQSLFLPILPLKMLDFLDAPVPFIVGLQHKPADLKLKTSDLVQVNVVKDKVKCRDLPQLPQSKELISELRPIHAALYCEDYISQKHPVYKCDNVQAKAAEQFLNVMRRYLESLCSDLRSHTITSVQSNNDRVSILHKDSFIDSFPVMDQHFVKLFVETQLFTVLSDSHLSSFDNEHY